MNDYKTFKKYYDLGVSTCLKTTDKLDKQIKIKFLSEANAYIDLDGSKKQGN
jgi:hypothetical protein